LTRCLLSFSFRSPQSDSKQTSNSFRAGRLTWVRLAPPVNVAMERRVLGGDTRMRWRRHRRVLMIRRIATTGGTTDRTWHHTEIDHT
jgi:hypothetical protein